MRRFEVERPARLDRIAAEIYGRDQAGSVEALLDANPGLAALAVEVPAGFVLRVPEVVIAARETVRPWI